MVVRFVAVITAVLAILAAVVGSAQTVAAPIVVLISFDGWRWDYTDRAEVPPTCVRSPRAASELRGSSRCFPPRRFPIITRS